MKTAITLLLLTIGVASAQRFYADDPLWKEPPPISAPDVKAWKLNNLVDFYKNTFKTKGERHHPGKIYPSQGMNTLDEVPDNAWYTNRHRTRRMTLAELAAGPGSANPPAPGAPWDVVGVKTEGVTPGFTIKDSRGRRFLVKFDPIGSLEMATAADVVGSKFFYAFGYNTPENYVVQFKRDQLRPGKAVKFLDLAGQERELEDYDIDQLLERVPRTENGEIRAIASRYLSGKPLDGFKYYSRRPDDPNEIAPHEHLRVLRGLYVFCAWLNHTDAKSLNSLDMLVEENGRSYVKHHLIDFGAIMGSDSVRPKDPRLGHEFFLDWGPGALQLATVGLYVPEWQRANFPHYPSVGHFDSETFQPNDWKSNYPNAAFANRLPQDEFWAAKQVMAFTDEEIRAMVHTGQYSNAEAEKWIADTLIHRRNKLGRVFFAKLLPLDRFEVRNGQLVFADLAVEHGFVLKRNLSIAWAKFDNQKQTMEPLASRSGAALPAELRQAAAGSYWAAVITNDEPGKKVTVILRKEGSGWKVVGIDRETPVGPRWVES